LRARAIPPVVATRLMSSLIRHLFRRTLRRFGFDVVRVGGVTTRRRDGTLIPDAALYGATFAPWNGLAPFERYYRLAEPYTLVSRDRCWVLYSVALQALRLGGDVWECGVYKGGTARMLARLIADAAPGGATQLHLFDTFTGMPETDRARDVHVPGDFGDTSAAAVRERVAHADRVVLHPGLIPDTFAGLAARPVALAHVDVDIYQAVLDCCRFILPRLAVGGAMVFDDYGFPSCPGARQAVDEFFAGTPFVPLVLPTGQAIVFKSQAWG
jgi:O-methyltransferase